MVKWEDICDRCGLCCHRKAISGDYLLLDIENPCEHYDKQTHLCKIYNNRFEVEKTCKKVTPFLVAFSAALPSSCAYVRLFKKYHLRFNKKETVLAPGLFNEE